jgi:hypothetical protein
MGTMSPSNDHASDAKSSVSTPTKSVQCGINDEQLKCPPPPRATRSQIMIVGGYVVNENLQDIVVEATGDCVAESTEIVDFGTENESDSISEISSFEEKEEQHQVHYETTRNNYQSLEYLDAPKGSISCVCTKTRCLK